MKERALTVDTRVAKGLHDGSITCVVRVIDPQPVFTRVIERNGTDQRLYSWGGGGLPGCDMRIRDIVAWSPFGGVGERLFVQEEWAPLQQDYKRQKGVGKPRLYEADSVPTIHWLTNEWGCQSRPSEPYDGAIPRWRAAEQMPRWASRTRLEVTDVRVVRVQEVSYPEIHAMGFRCDVFRGDGYGGAGDRNAFHEAMGWEVASANSWLFLATVAKVNPERKPEKSE